MLFSLERSPATKYPSLKCFNIFRLFEIPSNKDTYRN
jgi:hypothetical protein